MPDEVPPRADDASSHDAPNPHEPHHPHADTSGRGRDDAQPSADINADADASQPPRRPVRRLPDSVLAQMAEDAKRPHGKHPKSRLLNVLSVIVGLIAFGIGLWFLISNETPMFAIPLVVTVPVIVAVAFRNLWD